MARTRTWSTTIPVDHTQIKNLPDRTRDLREDLEERVDGILAGFVNTGATNGLLLGRLLTVGTNNALTPGTGTAGAYDVYCLTTGSTMELFGKDNAGNVIQYSSAGKIPEASLPGTLMTTGAQTFTGNKAIVITSGVITGITDLALADGGTGAGSAAGAYTNIVVPKVFDSGWVAVTTGTSYSVAHGLGSSAILLSIYFNSAANGSGTTVLLSGDQSDRTTGSYVYGSDSTNVDFRTGASHVYLGKNGIGADLDITNGGYRLIALRVS